MNAVMWMFIFKIYLMSLSPDAFWLSALFELFLKRIFSGFTISSNLMSFYQNIFSSFLSICFLHRTSSYFLRSPHPSQQLRRLRVEQLRRPRCRRRSELVSIKVMSHSFSDWFLFFSSKTRILFTRANDYFVNNNWMKIQAGLC